MGFGVPEYHYAYIPVITGRCLHLRLWSAMPSTGARRNWGYRRVKLDSCRTVLQGRQFLIYSYSLHGLDRAIPLSTPVCLLRWPALAQFNHRPVRRPRVFPGMPHRPEWQLHRSNLYLLSASSASLDLPELSEQVHNPDFKAPADGTADVAIFVACHSG